MKIYYYLIFIILLSIVVEPYKNKQFDDSDDKIDKVDKPRPPKKIGYCVFSRPYRKEFDTEKDSKYCKEGYILRDSYCVKRCFSGTFSLNDPLRCKIVPTCERFWTGYGGPAEDCDVGMYAKHDSGGFLPDLHCYSKNECLGKGYIKMKNEPYCIPPHYINTTLPTLPPVIKIPMVADLEIKNTVCGHSEAYKFVETHFDVKQVACRYPFHYNKRGQVYSCIEGSIKLDVPYDPNNSEKFIAACFKPCPQGMTIEQKDSFEYPMCISEKKSNSLKNFLNYFGF